MSKKRELYSSGAEWEEIAGYSRAIKVGDRIEVAGTTSIVGGKVVGKGDIYLQTQTILKIIKKAIEGLGGEVKDVIRTKMYVTDISQWETVAKAHGELFSEIRPATTMVEVSALIDPELMVEIEASVIMT
ncbi:MAG: enamine deaminase RidA (YjgF/YER057c/UK114 family) [Saprospiraceae bacterium]|jgi:enamine deaminase RidA (YjgF/YER057c/UK114 family)|tara:strand:+ start:1609 stop:1998 length:390 start_codon:yes stop_codon:yes gene_type:complete